MNVAAARSAAPVLHDGQSEAPVCRDVLEELPDGARAGREGESCATFSAAGRRAFCWSVPDATLFASSRSSSVCWRNLTRL